MPGSMAMLAPANAMAASAAMGRPRVSRRARPGSSPAAAASGRVAVENNVALIAEPVASTAPTIAAHRPNLAERRLADHRERDLLAGDDRMLADEHLRAERDRDVDGGDDPDREEQRAADRAVGVADVVTVVRDELEPFVREEHRRRPEEQAADSAVGERRQPARRELPDADGGRRP